MTPTIPAPLLHRRSPSSFGTAADRNAGTASGTPQDVVVESLGGYRLVRRLGAGANSEVWLGSDGAETVAVKVYRAEADGARIDAEIEALGRASHRHILRLEDLAMGPGGNPCLVLQRLSSLSLAGLLARSAPTPGEAVTILVPLVRAVAELHRVGVAHGALRASAVLFDDSGAPVLAGLGRAILFGDFPADSGASLPPARMAVESSVAHDLAGLVSICTATATRDEELSRWLSSCSPRDGHDFAEELVERLYSSAEPTPVRLGLLRGHREPESRAGPGSIPERIDEMGRPAAEPVAPLPATDPAATDPAATGLASTELASLLHLPDDAANSLMRWMGALLERGPIATLKARVVEVLRPVRKAVWIVAGLVAVVVVAVTAVLPPGASGRDDPPVAVPVETTATPAAPGPAVSAAIGGDDPALAAIALLDVRVACFSALSVLCLDAVDQQGSAAMSADAAQIRLLQAGGIAEGSTGVPPHSLQAESSPTTSDRLTAEVVERLGDSVLLAVTDTDSTGTDATGTDATGTPSGFSVLLIRIDGEWRIRDVLATGGPAG